MRLQAKGRACAKTLGRREQNSFNEPKGAQVVEMWEWGQSAGPKPDSQMGVHVVGRKMGSDWGHFSTGFPDSAVGSSPEAGPGNMQTSARGLLVAQLWTEKLS